MKHLVFCISLLHLTRAGIAQSSIGKQDSSNSDAFILEGYIDLYFAYDQSEPKGGDRPYFVSYTRHAEFNVNLAYLSAKYSSNRIRANLTPGFGTYMNTNYASEKGTLGYLLEANAGFKLFSSQEIWVDVGVLPSPYSNESPVSMDQLCYTRSFSSEYVPYYLSGARISIPLHASLKLNLFLLNGWQQIQDQNTSLSIGTQLEYCPRKEIQINWNTYTGNEESAANPDYGIRYFSDLYFILKPTERWNIQACVYGGIQEVNSANSTAQRQWWQANIAARYNFTAIHSVSGRLEYFNDPEEAMISNITASTGFNCGSVSLGYNCAPNKHLLCRFETRYFTAQNNVFLDKNSSPLSNNLAFFFGLTSRF